MARKKLSLANLLIQRAPKITEKDIQVLHHALDILEMDYSSHEDLPGLDEMLKQIEDVKNKLASIGANRLLRKRVTELEKQTQHLNSDKRIDFIFETLKLETGEQKNEKNILTCDSKPLLDVLPKSSTRQRGLSSPSASRSLQRGRNQRARR